jgi:hypothetical protein
MGGSQPISNSRLTNNIQMATPTVNATWTGQLSKLADDRAVINTISNKTKWIQTLMQHDLYARSTMLSNVMTLRAGKGTLKFKMVATRQPEMENYWANKLWPALAEDYSSTTFELVGYQGDEIVVTYLLPKGNEIGRDMAYEDWDQHCANLLLSLDYAHTYEKEAVQVETLMSDEMTVRTSMLNACKSGMVTAKCNMGRDLNKNYFTQVLQPYLCREIPLTQFELADTDKLGSSIRTDHIVWKIIQLEPAMQQAAPLTTRVGQPL